jgi:ATP-binding cassette subfamily B protein/subfamily B ATP-binding cassette protein MsbA
MPILTTRRLRRSRALAVLPYVVKEWRGLVLILAATLLSAAMAVAQPWPLKIIVDNALGGEPLSGALSLGLEALALSPTPITLILGAAIAGALITTLTAAMSTAITWGWAATGGRMVFDLMGAVFHQLQRASITFVQRRHVGDLLERLTVDTYALQALCSELLVSPVHQLLTVGGITYVAWRLDPQLTVLALILAPAMSFSAWFFGKRLKGRTTEGRRAESDLSTFVHQTLTAIPMVQAFGRMLRNREQFRALSARAIRVSQQGVLAKHSYSTVNGATFAIGSAIVLFVGGMRVLNESLSVGSLLVFMAYLRSIRAGGEGLLNTYASVKQAEAKLDRVLEVLDTAERVEEKAGAPKLERLPRGRGGRVRVEGVTFGYEAGRPVLRDVSLEAGPGEVVGLVGATGSGKSTLVSLIPRFFDPWEGRVLFDGVDIREVKLSSLRDQVSLVLQEPFLLAMSVADNIAYGRPEASREEIVAAAEAAQADAFIRELPNGYETVIGERGATLSGGQRQRIAIARALLKDAPVLILDEPTSALDAQTESSLLGALDRLMEGRTTFVVAHRLSTIRRADRIVVVEGGCVVEEGSAEALMAAQGRYHQLAHLQASRVSALG